MGKNEVKYNSAEEAMTFTDLSVSGRVGHQPRIYKTLLCARYFPHKRTFNAATTIRGVFPAYIHSTNTHTHSILIYIDYVLLFMFYTQTNTYIRLNKNSYRIESFKHTLL